MRTALLAAVIRDVVADPPFAPFGQHAGSLANWLAFLAVAGLVFGAAAATVARSKGRSPKAWFALGFLLNVFGLAAVFLVRPLAAAARDDRGGDRGSVT